MNILITGGASGLGASIVKKLAADKADTVWFTYFRSADAAKAIEQEFSNAHAIHCDITSETSLAELLAQVPSIMPDVLVNNAYGSIHKEHFYKTDHSIFLQSFEQNIMPTLRITQEAIKVFRKKKFGKIINIISAYTLNKPPTGLSAYVANKAYLLSMSRSWASEYARFSITSNSISPSFMITGLTADSDERIVEQMKEEHPLKQLLHTDEVAEAVSFFTRCSQQVNGTHMPINAGADLL